MAWRPYQEYNRLFYSFRLELISSSRESRGGGTYWTVAIIPEPQNRLHIPNSEQDGTVMGRENVIYYFDNVKKCGRRFSDLKLASRGIV
jgi:hypothetical protein